RQQEVMTTSLGRKAEETALAARLAKQESGCHELHQQVAELQSKLADQERDFQKELEAVHQSARIQADEQQQHLSEREHEIQSLREIIQQQADVENRLEKLSCDFESKCSELA